MSFKSTILNPLLASGLCACFLPGALAQTEPPCKPEVTLGFFNGVGNTLAKSVSHVDMLQPHAQNATGANISQFKVFYNNTDGYWSDVTETFTQRAMELDPTGDLANRLELSQYYAYSGKTSDLSFFNTLKNHIIEKSVELNNKYTQSLIQTNIDYYIHNKKIEEMVGNNYAILYVAHSQGNLFANRAYDYTITLSPKALGAVTHVAPASVELNGDYILNEKDFIVDNWITGSRPATFDRLAPLTDPTGHDFQSTYLNPEFEGLGQIKTAIKKSYDGVVTANKDCKKKPRNPETQVGSQLWTVYPKLLPFDSNAGDNIASASPEFLAWKYGHGGRSDVSVTRCEPWDEILTTVDRGKLIQYRYAPCYFKTAIHPVYGGGWGIEHQGGSAYQVIGNESLIECPENNTIETFWDEYHGTTQSCTASVAMPTIIEVTQ